MAGPAYPIEVEVEVEPLINCCGSTGWRYMRGLGEEDDVENCGMRKIS